MRFETFELPGWNLEVLVGHVSMGYSDRENHSSVQSSP